MANRDKQNWQHRTLTFSQHDRICRAALAALQGLRLVVWSVTLARNLWLTLLPGRDGIDRILRLVKSKDGDTGIPARLVIYGGTAAL